MVPKPSAKKCSGAAVMISLTTENTALALIEHWKQFGLPKYVQFDNDMVFQGPRTVSRGSPMISRLFSIGFMCPQNGSTVFLQPQRTRRIHNEQKTPTLTFPGYYLPLLPRLFEQSLVVSHDKVRVDPVHQVDNHAHHNQKTRAAEKSCQHGIFVAHQRRRNHARQNRNDRQK